MSETAQQLVATFESLPPEEQHQVLVEILRTSREVPGVGLSDDDLTSIADGLFQTIDAEESHGGGSDPR